MNILYYTEIIGVGGVENMMLQWVGHSDPDIHFDVFVNKVVDETNRQKFINLGCEVFEANCSVRNIAQKARKLANVFKHKKYDIVHVHTSLAVDFFVNALAKRFGVRHRIAHSHNVPVIPHRLTRWADKLCKPLLRHYTTDYYGCSKQAAISLFGNKKKLIDKYIVIKNGIEVSSFRFSMSDREEKRKELCISGDDYVIGSVGRLDYQKNYGFLLRCVSSVKAEKKRIKVIIIGDGEERYALSEYAQRHGIGLILTGKRDDVNKYLSCFDLFVLTSRYEGFPVVMMEAQANGLTCLVSNAIPEESFLGHEICRVSLEEKCWIQTMQKMIDSYVFCRKDRDFGYLSVLNSGFDISSCSHELMMNYRKMAGL